MARRQEYDAQAARELELFIENDRWLIEHRRDPLIRNYQRRFVKRKYDPRRAEKGLLPVVRLGAQRYAKEYARPGDERFMFSPQVKKGVAKSMHRSIFREMLLDNWY